MSSDKTISPARVTPRQQLFDGYKATQAFHFTHFQQQWQNLCLDHNVLMASGRNAAFLMMVYVNNNNIQNFCTDWGELPVAWLWPKDQLIQVWIFTTWT